MVHWIWVLVALVVGGCGGLLASALCVMSCGESVEDQIDRESCQGCEACKPGCTD